MKTTLITLLLCFSGLSLANQGPLPETVPAKVQCSWLLTEAECSQHRQVLASLQEAEARATYLEWYMAMLHEREVMCGCGTERQVLARAYYR